MATKDISDLQVCVAYAHLARQIEAGGIDQYVDDYLMDSTGQPQKVCQRAMERAQRRGLVKCGTWLRQGWLTDGGWLTDKGRALLCLPPRPPIAISPSKIAPSAPPACS